MNRKFKDRFNTEFEKQTPFFRINYKREINEEMNHTHLLRSRYPHYFSHIRQWWHRICFICTFRKILQNLLTNIYQEQFCLSTRFIRYLENKLGWIYSNFGIYIDTFYQLIFVYLYEYSIFNFRHDRVPYRLPHLEKTAQQRNEMTRSWECT